MLAGSDQSVERFSSLVVVRSRRVKTEQNHSPSTFLFGNFFPAPFITNSPFQPSDWRGLRVLVGVCLLVVGF
jgi:hypothetical protein